MISFYLKNPAMVDLKITNIAGVHIKETRFQGTAGNNKFQISNLRNVEEGVYIVQLFVDRMPHGVHQLSIHR